MPIRPELRKFYGPEWRAYRLQLIERHGNRCRSCGHVVMSYLNLAHATHDPRSSDVLLLCAACHNRHDARHRLAIWRRNKARCFGQLWLWPEVEWEPIPLWMRPRAWRAPATQERLF